MTNIPTDLLRTLIAVIDLRSFTRAAQSLGVTQPAVSAQIKRLQLMLGVDLFDKSAPGVTLTANGEVMVNYARRMLALNDQMLDATTRGGAATRLRVGVAVDYFEGVVLDELVAFRAQNPGLRMQITAGHSASVLRDLRRGDYDLVVAASESEEPQNERRRWSEPSAWGAALPGIAEADGPVPLLVVGESSLSRRLSVAALEQAGVDYEIVYVGGSFAGLIQAAKAGLGVACWARRLLRDAGLTVIENSRRLPKVPAVCGGVHIRDGAPFAGLDALADAIAARMKGLDDAASEGPTRRLALYC
ncbi:MAG TPA: LysR family transcriptional regulator [Xanthobacteraceae bacterium]|nr:LysR family transcriptional regulator [Xanthobacteraceae bacterium]